MEILVEKKVQFFLASSGFFAVPFCNSGSLLLR